jgi:protocatechuate 3,4-dioxygenase beta subunit
MKKIIISGFLVLFTLLAFTTNFITKEANETSAVTSLSLSGNVMDLTSGETLAGVEVKLEGCDTKVYTDFDGNYSFTNLKPGKYNVIASYISYDKSYIEKIDLTSNGDLNIKLQTSN